MKVSLRIDYLSSKKLAPAIALCSVAILAITRTTVWMSVFFALLLLAGWLWTRDWYLVMRPAAPVADRVRQVFDLLALQSEPETHRIRIVRPRAIVGVRDLGEFALLSFAFHDHDGKTERVLKNAVLKMMRRSWPAQEVRNV
jgi:hypothetical protein